MQRRTELLVAGGIAVVLMVGAAVSGGRLRPGDVPDGRASSFLTDRDGVRGLAEVAERSGVPVEQWRQRSAGLDSVFGAYDGALFAVIQPARALTPDDQRTLARSVVTLLLAGPRTEPVMRCFGFRIEQRFLDSSRVVAPREEVNERAAWTTAALVRLEATDATLDDEAAFDDQCGEPQERIARRVNVLLTDTEGRWVMALLTMRDDRRRVLLLADDALVRNAALRETATGAPVVAAILAGTTRLVFDEYHQGFGPRGSMGRVAIDWSRRHPVGWMLWQLFVVGVLVLVARGIRFGPVVPAFDRRRRSSLEHVRALATALASARGGAVAVGAIIRGLRRRLEHGRHDAGTDEWRPWLDRLERSAPDTNTRKAIARLRRAAENPKPDAAALAAANAAEDVWSSLHR